MGLLSTDIQTRAVKIIIDIQYYSLFFLTDLKSPDQADKNMDNQGISSPFRKWPIFYRYSNPQPKRLFSILVIFPYFFYLT